MTEREALKLALSVLDEVRSETFRLLRNGQNLYAEEKVWNAIFAIKEVLAQPERTWVGFTEEEFVFWCGYCRSEYLSSIEKELMEKNT